MNMNVDVIQELNMHLDRTADRIVDRGTRTEAPALVAMAEAARQLMPGASAALVDWDGSEVARLRAFGIVHGAVIRDLPSEAQARLLTRLRGGFADEPAADVLSSQGARSAMMSAAGPVRAAR